LIEIGFFLSQGHAIRIGKQPMLIRPQREVNQPYPQMVSLDELMLVSLPRKKEARHMKIGEEVNIHFLRIYLTANVFNPGGEPPRSGREDRACAHFSPSMVPFDVIFQEQKTVGGIEKIGIGTMPVPAIGIPPDQSEKLLHGGTGIEMRIMMAVIGETTERETREWLLGETESVYVFRSVSRTIAAGPLERTVIVDAIRETLVASGRQQMR
jgi:hypothetical protein